MKNVFSIYYRNTKFTVTTMWECELECHGGHDPTCTGLNARPRAGTHACTRTHMHARLLVYRHACGLGGASGATTNPTWTGGGFL